MKLLKYVRPYWLREKLFWWFCVPKPERNQSLSEAARLEFALNTVMKLKPSDIGHRQIGHLGWTVRHLSRLIQSLAKQPGLFVDVGANYGYFTLLWASASPMHRVVAFEATPRNLAPLNTNIALNHLESRVSVVPKAAGAGSGTMRFQLGPEEQTGWGGLVNESSLDTVEVAVTTLDSHFSSGEEKIAVLKIDVEARTHGSSRAHPSCSGRVGSSMFSLKRTPNA